MRKLLVALTGALLWTAPATAGTVVAYEKGPFLIWLENGIGGQFTASSKQTLITFSSDDAYFDWINVEKVGDFPGTQNEWLNLPNNMCNWEECIGPLSAIIPTIPGVTYSANSMWNGSYDTTFVEITEQAVVPEPSSWFLLLTGFGLAGMLLRRPSPTRLGHWGSAKCGN